MPLGGERGLVFHYLVGVPLEVVAAKLYTDLAVHTATPPRSSRISR